MKIKTKQIWIGILSAKIWILLKCLIGGSWSFGKILSYNFFNCKDKGSEFFNRYMRQFCEEQEIKQTTPYTTSHAPHVERVQATLQNLIYKHITSRMNFRYIDNLDKLVSTYNNRVHRSTGLTPNQGKGLENVWKYRCVCLF